MSRIHTTGKSGKAVRRSRKLIAFAALCAISITALGTTERAEPTGATDSATLNLSMVELLSGETDGNQVWLYELRRDVMRRGRFSGSDGSGVDVALIDSGVAPVAGLDEPGKVLHGPDLSSEGSAAEVAYIDTYGHGTHMAGIIAGNRDGKAGIAPGARLVSLKVAGADGATTIPQVIAAIDWVVEHHDTDGLNIRVLNLSLGQPGVSSHEGDLLSAAVERAWNEDIFVVVAAGNNGDTQPHLDSPAIDPYVFAVGAADSSTGESRRNQPVPEWSATGDGVRNPDVVAPGRSIISYRVPGSTVDIAAPDARRGSDQDLFVGSGTSQSAAVISGLAARLIGEHPDLEADDLKRTFTENAKELTTAGVEKGGAGRVNRDIPEFDTQDQQYAPAAGPGTGLEAPDADEQTWTGGGWSEADWTGATWTGATWTGATWTGAGWS